MKRCLVADQSEIIRKVARHYLEAQSLEVVEAERRRIHRVRVRRIEPEPAVAGHAG